MSDDLEGQILDESPFADPTATVTAHAPWWPADWQVVLLRDMDYATRRATENAIVSARRSGQKVDVETEVAAGRMIALQRMIISWTFKDPQGNPVPVTPENIDRLKGKNAEYLSQIIARNNPDPDMDEDADFLPAPAAGSKATGVRLLRS